MYLPLNFEDFYQLNFTKKAEQEETPAPLNFISRSIRLYALAVLNNFALWNTDRINHLHGLLIWRLSGL
mgnify:CR=1 FL=1|jgi:hypothetical protein